MNKTQMTQFGANPKKIMCQCNAEAMDGEIITIQMSGRCPVCNSLYRISIPKAAIKALQKQKTALLDRELMVPAPVEVLMYRSSDWMTGVLAL